MDFFFQNSKTAKTGTMRILGERYNSRGVAIKQFNIPLKRFQLYPAFILLLIGHGVALFQFVIELVKFKL